MPDPAAPVTARLAPGLEVSVAERRGNWAKVFQADGSSGWVDARRLIAGVTPAAPRGYAEAYAIATAHGPIHLAAPAPVATRVRAIMPAVAGGAALCVSALLPWIRSGGRSVDAFGVPVEFLLSYRSAPRLGLQVGLFVFSLGIVGGLVAVAAPAGRGRKVIGLTAVVVTSLFTLQVQQRLGAMSGGSRPSLLSTVGLGVYLALAGGLALALVPKQSGTAR